MSSESSESADGDQQSEMVEKAADKAREKVESEKESTSSGATESLLEKAKSLIGKAEEKAKKQS